MLKYKRIKGILKHLLKCTINFPIYIDSIKVLFHCANALYRKYEEIVKLIIIL